MEQAVDRLKCNFYNAKVPMGTWQHTYPFIKEAAEYSGEYTAEEILQYVEKGQQELWVVSKNGTIVWTWVTEVQKRNGRQIVQVVSAGGRDLEAGWYFWPLMSNWMKGLGIEKAEVWCRPPMAKLLKKYGLKTQFEVLEIMPEVTL